jgi:hypothetical protein
MKKWIFIIFCATDAMAFTSCSTVGTNTKSQEHQIFGRWKLIRITGGFAGVSWGPGSPEFPKGRHVVVFNNNHTFSFFVGKTIVKSGDFKTEKKDKNTILHLKNINHHITHNQQATYFPNQRVTFISSGKIRLYPYECYDCFGKTYKRVH